MKKLVPSSACSQPRSGSARLRHRAAAVLTQGGNSYSIGLWGDVPYSVHQQTIGVPNLIADMNSSHLVFTVHDGDLKQGSGSLVRRRSHVRSEGYLNSLGRRPCTRPATTNGPTATAIERQLQLARAPQPHSRDDVRHAVLVRRPPDAAGRAGRSVRRGPALGVRAGDVRDPQHPGLRQQPDGHES